MIHKSTQSYFFWLHHLQCFLASHATFALPFGFLLECDPKLLYWQNWPCDVDNYTEQIRKYLFLYSKFLNKVALLNPVEDSVIRKLFSETGSGFSEKILAFLLSTSF